MFNISSQITLKVKFLRNEEQHCLLPSLVDDFTCVHSKNSLLTHKHILSTLFSSTSVLFSCTPFGTKSYIYHIYNSTRFTSTEEHPTYYTVYKYHYMWLTFCVALPLLPVGLSRSPCSPSGTAAVLVPPAAALFCPTAQDEVQGQHEY